MTNARVVNTIAKVRFVEFVYKNRPEWIELENLPYLRWPDGRPNNYANLYLLSLVDKRLSTVGRGGTLRQYAYVIGRYIVFCYQNLIDLLEISYAEFSLFAASLRVSSVTGKTNSGTTALTNGKIVLDFLSYVEELQGLDVVCGRLRAERKIITHTRNGRTFNVEIWSHPSFGTPSEKKHRSAIEDKTIEALRAAAERSSADAYVVARRQILLLILEITGARIGEAYELKVGDIVAAREHLMLRLITLKRRGPHTRELPILRQDLADIEKFLILRKIAVKSSKTKDDEYLFFSIDTGHRMSKESLGNEIGILKRLSGIVEQASAHLFRHRFVTKIIIHLIEAHEFKSPKHMRQAFQEIESLKVIVREWTGHAWLSSLDNYIDTAFSEWKGIRKSVDKAFSRRASDAFEKKANELASKLGTSLNANEFRREFLLLTKNLEADKSRHVILRQEP